MHHFKQCHLCAFALVVKKVPSTEFGSGRKALEVNYYASYYRALPDTFNQLISKLGNAALSIYFSVGIMSQKLCFCQHPSLYL